MSKQLPPSRTAPQFVIRFPGADLRDQIKQIAETNNRSMNAQIVHMLQSYFEQIDKELSQIEGFTAFGDPEINAALVKALKFDERSILKARVSRLGGTDAVLKANKADLVKKIEGDEITRTSGENVSYYSKIVGDTPVTALLTTDEIQKIAERLDSIQSAHKKLANKTSDPKK